MGMARSACDVRTAPEADVCAGLQDVCYGPIVLKNSKIAGLRKSRKCSALVISATARLCRTDTRASDRFRGDLCGPSLRSERNAPAVLRIFTHQLERSFSTRSATFGLVHRSKNVLFDYLVGKRQELRGHIEAKCLCRLDVDRDFEFDRCLLWSFGGPCKA